MSASAPLTARQVVQTLQAIERQRALSLVESDALQRALARLDVGAGYRPAPRPWSRHEDLLLKLIMPRMARGRPRKGTEVRDPTAMLAAVLMRTEKAIESRARKLRQAEAATAARQGAEA